jgi:hypothetical protein
MPEFLRPILIALVTGLVIFGLSALMRSAKASSFDRIGGTIKPSSWVAWLTIVGGVGMATLGVSIFFSDDKQRGAALALALMGIAIAAFMAPSLSSAHSVHWNNEGLEGPSSHWGPALGLTRTTILWHEIERTGKTFTGYWFVEAADKRRVYWSYLYGGYDLLTQSLLLHRPTLELPDDLA